MGVVFMLSFVVCDDNYAMLEKLCKMLESIFINNNIDSVISLKATNALDVLDYSNSNHVDVFILDIDLNSKLSGLELAEKIREKNKSAYIIFSTGHLEYILLAYKVKTFDYLPKPITLEKLEFTILRLINDVTNNPKKYIRIDNKNTIICQDSVYYIQKSGMKLIFQTENRPYELYSSFNKIQDCLPGNFVRCHKSYIANLDKITDIKTSNTILFENKSTCYIGPKYKNNFMEVFKNGISSNNLGILEYAK